MKKLLFTTLLLMIIVGCKTEENPQAAARAAAEAAFAKNSQTVLASLEAWQSENVDYSIYADDFLLFDTGFNPEKDEWTKAEMIESDKQLFKIFDFKMLNEPDLLPGVDQETKQMDGSVRHYSEWEVTRSATDSTEAKSGNIRLYQAFNFNEEGKIVYQMGYADFTGLMMYLME
ncbi:hypothetical protein [Lentiprolixibacter aurantiacus]|uniref:Uncharacterized protein n=1 Tax=Lentiprolixibacter aurantiacus TaxID=2993939 RepID=A0AAE3ML45_9FLAO|nr:hypothetical protein [Lentiprolixibacter aurantiacus]MCX2718899.1 hypothetical protein [Lentiprolixibacter aurantiacus]